MVIPRGIDRSNSYIELYDESKDSFEKIFFSALDEMANLEQRVNGAEAPDDPVIELNVNIHIDGHVHTVELVQRRSQLKHVKTRRFQTTAQILSFVKQSNLPDHIKNMAETNNLLHHALSKLTNQTMCTTHIKFFFVVHYAFCLTFLTDKPHISYVYLFLHSLY